VMNFKQIDINSLTYLVKYASDVIKREQLYPLFERVFGINTSTLTDFSNRGLWNDEYLPYTFFDGNQAVANVSAFSLSMNINGKLTNCMGIQSVMTDPDYRKNGLMKILFQKMLDDLDKTYEGTILFTSSPELYKPYRFKIIKQHYFKTVVNKQYPKQKYPLRKLEPLTIDDLSLLDSKFDAASRILVQNH
jgi:predicted acetyltransferase